jgi:hypothetical protein
LILDFSARRVKADVGGQARVQGTVRSLVEGKSPHAPRKSRLALPFSSRFAVPDAALAASIDRGVDVRDGPRRQR